MQENQNIYIMNNKQSTIKDQQMSSENSQQFEVLTEELREEKIKTDAFSQTERSAAVKHQYSMQISPSKGQNKSEKIGQKTENNNQPENKAVNKLYEEINKLKMEIFLLRLQNNALNKGGNANRDMYYEQVINGMQSKIQELMEEKQNYLISQ